MAIWSTGRAIGQVRATQQNRNVLTRFMMIFCAAKSLFCVCTFESRVLMPPLFLSSSAQDQECGASKVEVDAYEVESGNIAITVQDDGVGMNRDSLHCMISFGFSSKEHAKGNVGRFGIGFKSGSMRLANDALILTRQKGEASAALLSTTFLRDIDADDILIPMFTWNVEMVHGQKSYVSREPLDISVWEENMGIIERYTFLKTESELLNELEKIKTSTGTRIVLFNLKRTPELDFDHDPLDIRIKADGMISEEGIRSSSRRPIYQQYRAGQQMTLDVPEDYSFRSYMEILYLRPTVTFALRGEMVVPRCPIKRLQVEYYRFDPYTPKGIPDERTFPIVIHVGYQDPPGRTKHCGFHMYNKNRLIRMYQRFGAQLQVNTMMKDLLGVVEADCLEPTHNKQTFNTTDIAYSKCQKYIEKCMNDYYFGVQNVRLAGIGTGMKRALPARRKTQNGAKKHEKMKPANKRRKQTALRDGDEEESRHGRGFDVDTQRIVSSSTPNKSLDPFPKILRKLMNNRLSWPFNEPVDAEYWGVQDYYEVIKTPMDFGTIATKYDIGDYNTENSGHGALKFVTDVRQVFYNAWTYNQPGHQVYQYAQILARIFETELSKSVGIDDKWGLLSGSTMGMTLGNQEKIDKENADMNSVKIAEEKGFADGSLNKNEDMRRGEIKTAQDDVRSQEYILNRDAIKLMAETCAARAVAEANEARDNALAKLQEERVAREAFEAELEAQTRTLFQTARHEEQARYHRFEVERETLMTCLSDSNNMKKLLQDRIETLEAEIVMLKNESRSH